MSVTTSFQPILPLGDSLPSGLSTLVHSQAPPQNAEENDSLSVRTTTESGLPTPGTSVTSTSSSNTTTEALSPSITPQGTEIANGGSAPLQAGAIVAIVLAIIMFIVFIIFAVRYYFVRQRASKVTPARARASQLAISGPTNFQHVASAGRNAHLGSTSDKHAADVGVAEAGRWTPERQPSLRSQTDSARDDGVWASSESPYNRNQQKYAVDFGALESGLRDHVQTMRNTRTNFP